MVPFDIVHENIFTLDFWDFDNVFEQNPNLSTFAERPVDFSFLSLVSLYFHLPTNKLLDIQELLTE